MWLPEDAGYKKGNPRSHELCQKTNVLFSWILTLSTNCAISLRYESISAMTKVATLCVNALVRTTAIFVFTLVNICVE